MYEKYTNILRKFCPIYIYIIQYKIKYMCTLIIEYYNINNNYKY